MADNIIQVKATEAETADNKETIIDVLDIDYWAMLTESRVL